MGYTADNPDNLGFLSRYGAYQNTIMSSTGDAGIFTPTDYIHYYAFDFPPGLVSVTITLTVGAAPALPNDQDYGSVSTDEVKTVSGFQTSPKLLLEQDRTSPGVQFGPQDGATVALLGTAVFQLASGSGHAVFEVDGASALFKNDGSQVNESITYSISVVVNLELPPATAASVISGHPTTPVVVYDTTANIQSNLDQLEASSSSVQSIALSSTGTQVLNVTGTQSHADSPIIQKITSPISLSITQTPGDSTMWGGPGNDTFHINDSGATAVVVGVANGTATGGHDTVVFHGSSSQYARSHVGTVGQTSSQEIITDTVSSRDGHITIESGGSNASAWSVQYLQFTDKTLFVENPDNANIARLYSAAFNRAPDQAGLNFWEDTYASNVSSSAKAAGYYTALAQTNDGSGVSIATNFMQSSEFQSRYGSLSDTAFVTLMYQNVLGRAPDQTGLTFWVNQIEVAHQTREIVLVGFAESPENVAKTSADWLIAV